MTTFLVSPPNRKPAIEKSEKTEEVVPRLILAPFSPQAEVKFGEVTINSVQWKPLLIFNPSVSMTIQFTNISPDDRISLSECEIQINSREEKQVLISWSPFQSGYLRKVIRAQDAVRKAKSFDVILSGMAVNKGIQNSKKKKLKSETNTIQTLQKYSNTTMTINHNTDQKLPDFRRETFSIEEKENRLPAPPNPKKLPNKSNSPPSDCNYLSVLNENSITTNFSRYYNCDSVDAPAKYSNFESEFYGSRRIPVNSSLSDEVDLRRSTFSINAENPIFSCPKNLFCDSLEEERSSTPTENVCEMNDDDVKMTPLKIHSESFLFSPQDNQQTMTSSINTIHTKSMSGFSSIEGSFVSNFSFKPNLKDEVLYISPPAKSIKSHRKLNDFIHRTESSAIKDRRKHIRSSIMSKKKLSPKKLLANGRSTTLNASTVEKIKSQNPQTLKQVVPSQGPIEDPFVQHDDQWLDEQEKDIIKWMNSILVPVDLSEEQADWTVDGAEAWIKRNYSCNSILRADKVPITFHTAPERLNILRERTKALLKSDYVKVVFNELSRQVAKKVIFVREGRDIYADEGIKTKLLQLLGCYNPVWLRMGLEAVYEKEIILQPKADFGGLGLFIRKTVIVTSSFVKKTEQEKEATRRMILLKFLQLIFFMDQARIQKLIRHNRCLFNLNSKHKASQNLLTDFCADLVSGRGYVMKHLKTIGYILQFKQTCIDEYDYTVTTLKDLNDGVRLARLFEILFSEPGLCAKLRVPAVDIENKKYNIEVAMRVAKTRCTIKGNITAEDFVLVTRLGSRLKILSFLWQIIYNYLTPLYEKATIKIQKWWRKQLIKTRLVRLQDQKTKDRSAQIIQTAWRKHCFRTRFRQLIPELRNQRQKKHNSARIIQTQFRVFLATKREREIFKHKIESIKVIQRWSSSWLLRKRFVKLKNAAILIQRWYRARKITEKYRTHFLELKENVIVIQRRLRARNEMTIQRTRFLKMKNASVKIQRRYRALMAMRKERKSFLRLKQCTISIQRGYRKFQLMKTERGSYLLLKNTVVVIQKRFRAQQLMKLERNKYAQTKQAVMKIQRYFRNYKLTCQTRNEFLTLKKCAILVQRTYRANVMMKVCRKSFLRTKASALTIQKWYRNSLMVKAIRSEYLHRRATIVKIQRRFRANHLMKYERQQYMRLRWAAVEIQRQFRMRKAMKTERKQYLELKATVFFVQRQFRANRKALAERNEFVRLRNSTLVIQRRFRATILMRAEHRHFLALKMSAITVQRRYRAKLLMRKQREEYEKIKNLTIEIQRIFRARQVMRDQRRRFLKLRIAAITIQRQWRMRVVRNHFFHTKKAASEIQRWWSRIQASKRQQCSQHILQEVNPVKSVEELAATKIQTIWRGYRIRKMALVPKRKSSDSKSTIPQSTLGERYRKAIDQIKNSDLYNVIFNALWNLERVTTFSAKLCEGVAAEGIVPIVFELMSRGNRSEPSLELYRSSISILINLTLYPSTKFVLWDNLSKEEDVAQIVHLMKVTYDKFFKKNDADVFRYSTTFLWLLCQEEAIAECIASLPFVKFHLEKMKNLLERKCPCRKNNKGKPVRKMLPKTETNWYADAKTRTFDDNCFAILNLYNCLYHRT